MSRLPFVLVLVVFPVWLGCSSKPTLSAPVQTTSAGMPEIATATEAFPPAAPGGEVRLATMGLTRMTADQKPAIQVRMVADNRSDQPWTIRESEQRLELDTQEQCFPERPNAGESLRMAEVPPRTKRALDLYFALPDRLRTASAVGPFIVIWTIHAGGLPFTQRTPFDGFPMAAVEDATPMSGDPRRAPVAGGRDLPGVALSASDAHDDEGRQSLRWPTRSRRPSCRTPCGASAR